MIEDRLHQQRNVGGFVLVVRIGVDNHVRAVSQAGVNAGHEGCSEPAVDGMAHYMVDAKLAREFRGAVGRAVVHH